LAGRIEDYAIVGDMQSVALICTDGSVDWLCLPRFDSDACFAALLGTEDHGQWRIAPTGTAGKSPATRRYAGDTLILETTWETPGGTVRVIDFMPPREGRERDRRHGRHAAGPPRIRVHHPLAA
jgi:GH15 family glucan-1,4-alpha-glucosidase